MEDEEILALYWARNEAALTATEEKYGRYCRAIAGSILGGDGDGEESVSDALLAAWNVIPPQRPENLGTFLGKLTRRAALKKYRALRAQKRGGGETALALEELAEVVPAGGGPDEALLAGELTGALDRFLSALSREKRRVFLRRYWYLDSVDRIAEEEGYTPAKVNSMLHRMRVKLRDDLKKEGLL